MTVQHRAATELHLSAPVVRQVTLVSGGFKFTAHAGASVREEPNRLPLLH
jgi:hypothetical protein